MAITPMATTLCEVAYDSDHRITPYRYQYWNSAPKISVQFSGKDADPTESSSGFQSPDWTNTFSLPSSSCTGSYLDYLRTLYECKSSCSSKSSKSLKTHRSNQRTSTGHHSSRLSYNPTQVSPRVYPAAYGFADNRPKTASIPPTQPLIPQQQYSLPVLHHGRAWGEEEGREDGEGDNKPDDRLVWVDALSKWIPENQLQKPSYVSFVGTAPVVEKLYATFKETPGLKELSVCDHKCARHEIHMEQHKQSAKCGLCGQYHQAELPPNHLHTHRLVTLKKREALRKRANEAAAERKQRKAYSSPLYSSLKDKRQKVRFQTPESDHRSGIGTPRNESDLDLHVMLPTETVGTDEQTEEGTDGQTEDETEVTEDSTEENQELSGTDNPVNSTDSSEQQTEPEADWSPREEEYVIISRSEVDVATAAMEAAEAEHREQLRMFEEMCKQREQEKEAQLAAALAKEEADRLAEEELIRTEISGEDMTMLRKRLTSESLISGQSDGQNFGPPRPKVPENKKSSASVSSSSSGQLKTSSSRVKASKSTSRTSTSRNKLDKKSSSKLNNKLSQEPCLPEISDVIKHTQSASSGTTFVKPPPKVLTKLLKEELTEVKVRTPVESKDKGTRLTPKGSKVTEEKPIQLDLPLPPMDMSLAKPPPLAFLQSGHERGEDNSKVPPTQVIPTVGDTRTGPLSLTVDDRPDSRGRTPSGRRKFSIVKKEKVDRRRVGVKVESPIESPVEELPNKRTDSWIYGQDDDESIAAGDTEKSPEVDEVPPLPADIPPPLPDLDSINKSNKKIDKRRRASIQTPIVQKLEKKLKRRQFSKDTSYEDELRKQELAEQRRQKHMEMLEKARARRLQGDMDGEGDEDGPNFDDYGFLAKYCIFNKSSVEMYRHTFDIVDDEQRGWLSATEVMVALRAVNNKLSHAEEEYLYRILELTGYSIKNGADFKLFSVVAALSQKIAALDNWMRNMIGKMDFGMLEMKLFMCKKLWECNVDHETNKISIDQLCVELRAGGVSLAHEIEVREKLSHLDALDLLDFLSYIPLFIMIHQSVVDNPLDDTRDK
ncbi:uncharacterized protein LOC117328267 isoform X3 [Pecten maximus]|uniref:uncharacterized protein LOC117328267 isoform X3 n=1 Tax=Pecten maximus TaxID=6579 RepID=UPI00145911CB|nr:uncharacterized protein LOC117328267 isoform X3 [Pecten maximus]